MKNTKLIQILKTFSKEEIKEFEKFVASPYFSRGRDLLLFYKSLKSYYPGFDDPDFTYERIFRKLYPKVKYNKSKSENLMRVISSELVRLTEEFLICRNLRMNKLRSTIGLLEEYNVRNLNNLFSSLYAYTQKDLSNLMGGFTSHSFADLYVLRMYEVISDLHQNKKLRSTLLAQVYLLNHIFLCSANFIQNAFITKFNYNIDHKENLTEQLMICFDFKKFITRLDLLKGIKKQDKDILELCFYHLAYTLDRDNKDYILKIEKLFYKTRHTFRNDHKLSFYYQLNTALENLNEPNKFYTLYKNLLGDKIYGTGHGREMPFMMYFNILFNFSNKNPDEAEKFILKYINYLNIDNKESFYNYSFALIEFKRKNFDKALEYIANVQIEFFSFKFHLKILYLQIYYELNYSEQALSMIDSFKHFLKKNKYVSEIMGERYKKFTDYYCKLVYLKIKISKSISQSEIKMLKKKISDEGWFYNKNWLLEKVNEL